MVKKVTDKNREIPCEICGGSGQIGMFHGVSRFVITWEDCPDCSGTGLQNMDTSNEKNLQKADKKDKE